MEVITTNTYTKPGITKADLQALAKRLYAIDWQQIQGDCPYAHEGVLSILSDIEKYLTPKQGLRLMLRVLEAKVLCSDPKTREIFTRPEWSMEDFHIIDEHINRYEIEPELPSDHYCPECNNVKRDYGSVHERCSVCNWQTDYD